MIGPRARASSAPQWIGKACLPPGSGCEVRRIWSVRFERLIVWSKYPEGIGSKKESGPKKATARLTDGPFGWSVRMRASACNDLIDLAIANPCYVALHNLCVFCGISRVAGDRSGLLF